MNFLRFDIETGKILQVGWMEKEFIEKQILEGMPIIFAPDYVDWENNIVNLETREIEHKPAKDRKEQ